jgi:(p)ppGpp synthase/HD superfamily hydrolase
LLGRHRRILHDTIEDADTAAKELTERFVEGIFGLVLEVTVDKRLNKFKHTLLQALS